MNPREENVKMAQREDTAAESGSSSSSASCNDTNNGHGNGNGDERVDAQSAWNVLSSPMLSSLHANPHSPRPAPMHLPQHHHQSQNLLDPTGTKRSISLGDSSELSSLLQPKFSMESLKNDLKSSSVSLSEQTSASATRQQQQQQHEEEGNPIGISILYGLINATIVLPVLMSFGSIIYRDEAFQPYLNVLIKLTVVSGVVHQLCFSTFSSLPFAVGQVQDAGLIFLSSMAATLVQECNKRGADDEAMLATVTVGLSLCTALLGLALVGIGKARLAQWVQLLPTCVVGGYLAYIGFFCGVSGVGLMAGTSELTWKIFLGKLEFILPGIVGGISIYFLVRKLQHMAVLPTCICMLFALFYIILWIEGSSIEEATSMGWIAETAPPPAWYHSWDYLKPTKVLWSTMPKLVATEISMIFVVALSSSLDIAAIELELKRPLDYDGELKMIGMSNFVSGMTGGYTGSYIFSQSIFSLRAGIRSRLAGYVLATCQILFFVAPISILAYVPNFFYGSLLSLICADLLFEWLIESRHKLTTTEYSLCIATFCLILCTGVEYGILLGLLAFSACKKMGFNVSDIELSSSLNNQNNNGTSAGQEQQYGTTNNP